MSFIQKTLEKLQTKKVLLCIFLDIEGAFDNTSATSISKASWNRVTDETSCRWIDRLFSGRLVYTTIMEETLVDLAG